MGVLGESVNSIASELDQILQQHANELRAPPLAVSPEFTHWGSTVMMERRYAAEAIEAVAKSITAEHAQNPVKLLGMYCGYSLLSAIYFLPMLFTQRLFLFCGEHPELCLVPDGAIDHAADVLSSTTTTTSTSTAT